MRWLLAALLITVLTAGVAAADLAVVQDGQARAQIVIASAAPEAVEAAEALQKYFRAMSGAELRLAPTEQQPAQFKRPAGPAVIVAAPEYLNALKLPAATALLAKIRDDGFMIWSDGSQTAVISAKKPTALVFAAYELLQKLGCRWFFPGELGEELPQLKTIRLSSLAEVQNPSMVDRNMWYAYGGRPDWQKNGYLLWRKQNRMGGLGFSAGHNLARIVPPSLHATHPEFFPLQGGKRVNPTESNNWQPCTSNPEVIALAVAAADKYFQETPDASSFSLSPNDGYGWCECDNCKAQDPAEQRQQRNQYKGRRTLLFVNAVARRIAPKHPGKYLAWYAYAGTVEPPTDVRAEPNVLTSLAHYGYCGCNVHPMADPNCPLNVKFMDIMQGWSRQADRLMVREYWSQLCPEEDAMGRIATAYALAEDIPLLVKRGFIGASAESEPECGSSALNFYLAAKFMWNSEQPLEPILADYYQGMYGPAAKPMRDFFEGIVGKCRERNHRGNFFTDEEYPAMAAELEQIAPLAATDKQRGRIKMTQDFVKYTTLLHQYNLKPTKALREEIDAFVAEVERQQLFTMDTVMHKATFSKRSSAAAIKEAEKLAVKPTRLAVPEAQLLPKLAQAAPTARGKHVFALLVAPGEGLEATVAVRRLGRYTVPTAWALVGPDAKLLQQGEATIEEPTVIALPQAQPGTYTIVVDSGQNACRVTARNRGLSLVGQQFDLLGGQPLQYVYVPAGTKSFSVRLETSAPGETGKLIVLDPTGAKVAEGDTTQSGLAELKITVPDGMDGKPWQVQIAPAPTGVMEDLKLSLGEGLAPFIAVEPARLLISE
ncbi:MAG: DUF4838 domain-containing protein [Armatimonadia bacterium]